MCHEKEGQTSGSIAQTYVLQPASVWNEQKRAKEVWIKRVLAAGVCSHVANTTLGEDSQGNGGLDSPTTNFTRESKHLKDRSKGEQENCYGGNCHIQKV